MYEPSWTVSALGVDAAVAAVDLDVLELLLVLLEVAEPEVAEPALVAFDALDDDVVVLAWPV